MLIEEDRHAHVLQHASGIMVTIIITDLKLDGELIGHRLHVRVEDGAVKATPIVAMLPLMNDEQISSIVAELIEEVTNIDIAELMGDPDEGP